MSSKKQRIMEWKPWSLEDKDKSTKYYPYGLPTALADITICIILFLAGLIPAIIWNNPNYMLIWLVFLFFETRGAKKHD